MGGPCQGHAPSMVGSDAAATLQAAHEVVARAWPGHEPPMSVEVAYHVQAAALYDHVARIDPRHHHEALFWANDHRQEAERLRQQANTSSTRDHVIPEPSPSAVQENDQP